MAGAWAQKKRLLVLGRRGSGMYSRMPPSQWPSRSRASGGVTASTKWRRSSSGPGIRWYRPCYFIDTPIRNGNDLVWGGLMITRYLINEPFGPEFS